MFFIVLGVSGSGKSTVGRMLADRLGCPFYDGDDFHPPENRDKMSRGIPLTDEDRAGWLQALADLIRRRLQADESGVLACSALKEKYRQVLQVDPARVRFVYLQGDYALILARMRARRGHYMQPGMLKSQFEVLEEPTDALVEDIRQSPAEIVADILRNFGFA